MELVSGKNDRAYKNSSATNEWYTPREYIDHAIAVMGGIDLDPASSEAANRNVQAARIYTVDDLALMQPWYGRVWLNPPYGDDVLSFVDKLLVSYESGDVTEALLLVAARTDTAWFRKLRAYPRCFIWGRIHFINGETGETGEGAGFPSMVVYLGPNYQTFKDEFSAVGDIYIWIGSNQ
jgi:phage N-6-adenine-methyltransferase